VRLADGLDRRRNSMVTSLDCSLSDSALTVRVKGESDVSVELFGARNNRELFEAAFHIKLVLVPALTAQ